MSTHRSRTNHHRALPSAFAFGQTHDPSLFLIYFLFLIEGFVCICRLAGFFFLLDAQNTCNMFLFFLFHSPFLVPAAFLPLSGFLLLFVFSSFVYSSFPFSTSFFPIIFDCIFIGVEPSSAQNLEAQYYSVWPNTNRTVPAFPVYRMFGTEP